MNRFDCLISDTHYHNFDQFSTTVDGINSRLTHIVNATREAFDEALKQGVKRVIHDGDCFHVRGKIIPSVLNPVLDLYKEYEGKFEDGIHMIAGNHDLEGRDSDWVSNASSSLAGVGVNIVTEPTWIDDETLLMPWFANLDDLRAELEKQLEGKSGNTHVHFHAPLNGVISGIPDNGFSYEELADFNAKLFFFGHYHNHKVFEIDGERKVVSVGALTHQNFGDIKSKAGYLFVRGDELEHKETSAPRFVDVNMDEVIDENDYENATLNVRGNFVRVRASELSVEESNTLRNEMKELGALGVSIVATPKTNVTERKDSVDTKGSETLEGSIESYVDSRDSIRKDRVKKESLAVLQEVGA